MPSGRPNGGRCGVQHRECEHAGYKAKDVEAFSLEQGSNPTAMKLSHPAHFQGPNTSPYLTSSNFAAGGDEYHSGNNVSIDREMLKASAVSREQNLNSGLMKAFNRLIAMSTRG